MADFSIRGNIKKVNHTDTNMQRPNEQTSKECYVTSTIQPRIRECDTKMLRTDSMTIRDGNIIL